MKSAHADRPAEIDLNDGRFRDAPDLAQKYREETLKIARSRLGLDEIKIPRSGDAIIDSFDGIGEALRESCSVGTTLTAHPFPLFVSLLIPRSNRAARAIHGRARIFHGQV